jgi:hypothetical protein
MWFFRPKEAAEKIRNPIQGEFFATDAIDGPAQALVRESVQNSLDARSGAAPVSVRITLCVGENALLGPAVAELFGHAWPHYEAKGNGLLHPPKAGSPCPYLLIEDFGTKGLTGDPTQSDPNTNPDIKNPFFLFFRAEGLSAKSGTELGRWGIGKFVFPRSSLISTHFGLTVRYDDKRRLLLGAATLKAHRIAGQDVMFSPDGLFGVPRHDGFVLPIEDDVKIRKICGLFGVTRETEPGLSVVVPFVDPEITFEKLLVAATKDYFLPILNGRLEITIKAGPTIIRLAADTLDQMVATHRALLNEGMVTLIALARSAAATGNEEWIRLQESDAERAMRWSDSLLAPEQVNAIRSRLASHMPVSIRVPVTVRSRRDGNLASSFDIHLLADATCNGRPLFIREGLIIADVRGRRAREIRSLVIIDDKSLAAMLGDSENPAHTQWQKDSSNFKGRYIYGPAMIAFVAESVSALLAIVNRQTDAADAALTVDFFSIQPPVVDEPNSEEAATPKRKRKPGDEASSDEVQIDPKPTRLRIIRTEGGFSVLPGSSPPTPPYLIEVRCAYDTRAGNPLKKWHSADFTLGPSGIPVVCHGDAAVFEARDNLVILKVKGAEYAVHLVGFDVNRDVYVRAEVHEVTIASPEV